MRFHVKSSPLFPCGTLQPLFLPTKCSSISSSRQERLLVQPIYASETRTQNNKGQFARRNRRELLTEDNQEILNAIFTRHAFHADGSARVRKRASRRTAPSTATMLGASLSECAGNACVYRVAVAAPDGKEKEDGAPENRLFSTRKTFRADDPVEVDRHEEDDHCCKRSRPSE